MKSGAEIPRRNLAMLGVLVAIAILCGISIVTSGQDVYIPPDVSDGPPAFDGVADPRDLAFSEDIVSSIDLLKTAGHDKPVSRDGLLIVDPRFPATLRGWSIDIGNNLPSLSVYTRVDSRPILRFPIAIPRPDVVRLYGHPSLLACGFAAGVDVAQLRPGRHRLTVWLTTSDGVARTQPQSIFLIVRPKSAVR